MPHGAEPPTRQYLARRLTPADTNEEVMRCSKRYAASEVNNAIQQGAASCRTPKTA